MTSPTTDAEVAGLVVPADLSPRIVAALRGVYGTLLTGIADDAEAVQEATRYWLSLCLQTHEAHQASLSIDSEVRAAQDRAEKEADKARKKAEKDAEKIQKRMAKAAAPSPTGTMEINTVAPADQEQTAKPAKKKA